MPESTSNGRINIARLILIPSVITLAVTILRLVGELKQWSPSLFNREAGGGGALVGISWLAIVFGIYFALKLSSAGARAASLWRTIGLAVLGIGILIASGVAGVALHLGFEGRLILGFAASVVAGAIQYYGWPALFKTLFAYALAARIPVAIIMWFAMAGNWGTHYDAVPPDFPSGVTLLSKYVWLGLLPQLTLWVAFTLIVGALFGGIATAIVHRRKPTAQAAQA